MVHSKYSCIIPDAAQPGHQNGLELPGGGGSRDAVVLDELRPERWLGRLFGGGKIRAIDRERLRLAPKRGVHSDSRRNRCSLRNVTGTDFKDCKTGMW